MEKISMYNATVPNFVRTLGNLKNILVKAKAWIKEKKIDEPTLLGARLALDQFSLVKQVQVASDNAKGTAVRLIGAEPPAFEDSEQTLAALVERIEKTIVFLETLTPEQFAGSEERRITLKYFPGKYLLGLDYLNGYGLPNFYFHMTTAYSILRHYGLSIGKADYIGELPFKDL
ncbi:MAG: hypothetical protein A3J06_02850 [Candidatus Moranbacteria bacterium RIFCSPLOWO2_02_FULL_48_19]|nr:MAG: hypothetical protein A3J06_02850 [Candidatus Moranbacteria bacterium RIFCSPLOWO2_02_FULL_48_19]OGI31420.1 MAG: hypothetical protein A3G09_03095 [Candidatus Moranbacteria bacterium RIFCSPLOWO2_12_FULL_48_12]